MKHETLTRLIEGATPDQLRTIARLVLRLSGYASSRITDGPYDGGTDIVIERAPGVPLPMAVAISVERNWQKKIRKDVDAAKRKLNVDQFLYISSRRIPESSFRSVQTSLRDSTGVHVDRMDQQSIADLVMDHDAFRELLDALDFPANIGARPTRPADRRRDAAYAYAFFAPEVRSFRKEVRGRSLLIALDQAGGDARINELCVDASRLLGMNVDDAPTLHHDLDRLRGQGKVNGRNGTVSLAQSERETMSALRDLRSREEEMLREDLRTRIGEFGLEAPEEALEALMQGLGALIARHIGDPRTLDGLRDHARRLRRELEAHGLPKGEKGDAFLRSTIELASTSEFGQSLAMGSLYQALTRLDRGALLRAFDARSIEIILDASVAIPMLCALFEGSIEQRFFVIAEELYRRAQNAELPLQIPDVWLEEMAAHLLKAREYVAFVEDEDLRQSKNAYVAYYAASRRHGRQYEFSRFLEAFGLTESLRQRADHDYKAARRELEIFLRRQLGHYEINVVATRTTQHHLDRAKKDWDWACHLLDIENRRSILQRHDQRVLAWLSSVTEKDPTHAPMITTWDRILRRARPDSAPGGAMDPLALVELLSFMSGSREPSLTVKYAGLQLSEAEAERGAAVLDKLVSFEHPDLTDAELSRRATAFKQEFLRNRESRSRASELERAWQEFQMPT